MQGIWCACTLATVPRVLLPVPIHKWEEADNIQAMMCSDLDYQKREVVSLSVGDLGFETHHVVVQARHARQNS